MARFLALTALVAALLPVPPGRPEPAVPKGPEPVPPAVAFMGRFIGQINPALLEADPGCVRELPHFIHSYARSHGLDWQRLFVLAWQESDFDCHAENQQDVGGAYGPFQIRRLWKPLIGDPRQRYADPERAVARVVQVIKYYQDTDRFQRLIERRFRHPLLCLYNTGENLPVNMRYCRRIGVKLRIVQDAWITFLARAAPLKAS